ncbi:MAG: hypothetical protein ABI565_04860 [Vicinamibacteria bacterium]
MPLLPLLVLAAAFQAPPGRPYREERQLLDRHLAQLARPLPDAPTPDVDAALLLQVATEAGLRHIEVGAPTITETGALGQSRRTLIATATYPDADRFFRALQASPRLIDVESLVLRTADFGVRIEARLRLHHRAARAAATASLDQGRARDRTRGATKEEAARFARDEQVALEKTIALDDLRRSQTSPRMFLAETGSAFRDAAAALTFGSLDGDTGRFTLRGVVAGMGAADALERRLEGGFFQVREFSRAQKDACYQFEVVGESFRAGPDAALPLPVDEPFRPTEPFCRQDRDGPGPVGAIFRAAGSEPGGLSLRAVDSDLADVAAMIESLSKEPFVVAEDVRGRVNVDFAGASIDDAIKALPVRVDRVGAVRLLRSSTGPATAVRDADDDAPTGRFSFRAKRSHGEDILAALAETEPAFVALGPSGLSKASVFAREAAVNDVRRAVLAALRLTETREESSRVLRFHDRDGGVGPIAASANARVIFRARDLTVGEMTLAGIGRSGDDYVAFVYAPLGEIVAVRLGDTLADGVIAALDGSGGVVDTAEGPVRISLTTLRPR